MRFDKAAIYFAEQKFTLQTKCFLESFASVLVILIWAHFARLFQWRMYVEMAKCAFMNLFSKGYISQHVQRESQRGQCNKFSIVGF